MTSRRTDTDTNTDTLAPPSQKRQARHRHCGDLAAWNPLRQRVLTELAARGVTRPQLAKAIGLKLSSLKSVLSPSRAPGRTTIAKFARWLERTAAPQSAAKAGNGGGEEVPSAHRLTLSQRERLAAYRELDERATRKELGVAPEILEAAGAGRSLALEVIGRLQTFLEQPPSSPTQL